MKVAFRRFGDWFRDSLSPHLLLTPDGRKVHNAVNSFVSEGEFLGARTSAIPVRMKNGNAEFGITLHGSKPVDFNEETLRQKLFEQMKARGLDIEKKHVRVFDRTEAPLTTQKTRAGLHMTTAWIRVTLNPRDKDAYSFVKE